MYQIPLEGINFDNNNCKVHCKLKEFLIDLPGWAWIEQYDTAEDGCSAYLAWTRHYNEEGELSKCTDMAVACIKCLMYKNKWSFSFEKYCEKIKRSFQALAKDPDITLSTQQQVDALLKGINTDNNKLTAAKTMIWNQYPCNFDGACILFRISLKDLWPSPSRISQAARQEV